MLVVDFGAQYAQLIARRVRELKVHSEIVPHRITAAEVKERAPKAIILSGGPKSVHVDGAPSLDADIYDLGVPVLGICYGAQLIAQQLGGTVGRGMRGEYGRTRLTRTGDVHAARRRARAAGRVDEPLRRHHRGAGRVSWPRRPRPTPRSPRFESPERKIWAVQFHPEVAHTPHGMAVLEQFLWRLAECDASWEMGSVLDEQVEAIRAQVGDERVLCALSGGVDSSVAAALVHRAVGPSSPASTSTPG